MKARRAVAGASYVGAFTPEERAYLERWFGSCQLTLLARGRLTPALALLRWEPARGPTPHASPLRRPFARGFYALRAEQGLLEPVPDGAALDQRFPGEFDPAVLGGVHPTWQQRLSESWSTPRPWHIVAVLIIWLGIAAYVAWQVWPR